MTIPTSTSTLISLIANIVDTLVLEHNPKFKDREAGILVKLCALEKIIKDLKYENERNNFIINELVSSYSISLNSLVEMTEKVKDESFFANTKLESGISGNYWTRY